MLRFLLIFSFACFAMLSVAGRAETPEFLIEERARQTWGPELPAEAHIRVRLNTGLEDAVMLSAFWMDRDTGRFLANAVTEAGDVRRLEGLALVTLDVPVPNRRMMPDEIVREADVAMKELPLRRVGAFAITERDKLVGKQVRRMLAQGRQVMTQSVQEPLVIDRGDQVDIVYDDGGLVLSAPGRALDDAHRGQELRIVNLVSNKSLRGVAREDGLVEVVR